MTSEERNEEVYETIWSLILLRVANTLASRYGLLFFMTPLLGLLPQLVFSLDENKLSTVMLNFSFWYIPLLLFSFAFFRGSNPNREKTNSKKYDQAILIMWGYNRAISILLSLLLINSVSLGFDQNSSPFIEEKSDVLFGYLVFALVIIVLVIFFRDKIVLEKANQLSGKSKIANLEWVLFYSMTFISLVISFILFPISQNNPKWVMVFSLGIVGSLITFFIGVLGFYELVVIWEWRKQNYWDKETTP